MRTLIASTAIAMTLAAPGFAQTAMPMNGEFVGRIDTSAMRASDLIGARLYVTENEVDMTAGLSPDWDDVGEISDIIVGGGGDIDAVLVDIGGFLGIGERTTAVNMDSLQFVSDGPDADDYFIVLTGNRAALEAAPAFEDTFERGRTRTVMAPVAGGTGMDTQAGSDAVVVGETNTSLEEGTVVDNPQTPATAVVTEGGTTVTTTTTDTDVAATDSDAVTADPNAEANVVATGQDAINTTGGALDQTADAAGDAVDATGNAIEQTADTAGNAVEATGDAVVTTTEQAGTAITDGAATVGTAAGGMVAAGGAMMAPPMLEREGYETIALDQLTTEDVTGASVYDINDKRVGEIGELVMADDGNLQDAIIDVGGFLGLGEKPVAVSFESLQILRSAADVRVYVDTTEEALEQLPEFQN